MRKQYSAAFNMQRAWEQAVPLICNSDQGSHFTSPQYGQLLQAAHIQISASCGRECFSHERLV
jgi:hypothetical protein